MILLLQSLLNNLSCYNHDWTDIFKPANLSPSNGLIFVKSHRGVPVCTVLDLTQCMSCYMYYITDNKPETVQES